MNWKLILTRTATILFFALLIGLGLSGTRLSIIDELPSPYGTSFYLFGGLYTVILIIIVSFNLAIIWQEQHRWRGFHVLTVIILCWLIGYPLSLLVRRLPFGAYTRASLLVLVPATAIAWILVSPIGKSAGNWIDRATAPANVDLTGLQPEQVSKLIGSPIRIITLESRMIYVYKHMKVVFANDKVIEIQ